MQTAVVIDDEDTIRHLMKLYLRKLNFKVHEATNGAEGLGVCLFQRPDLVITDISMPGYDGFQRRYDTDPNTSAAWTRAAVDATQIVFETST